MFCRQFLFTLVSYLLILFLMQMMSIAYKESVVSQVSQIYFQNTVNSPQVESVGCLRTTKIAQLMQIQLRKCKRTCLA